MLTIYDYGQHRKLLIVHYYSSYGTKTKRTLAQLFNRYFIHVANVAPEINERSFGVDFSLHPSIKTIA